MRYYQYTTPFWALLVNLHELQMIKEITYTRETYVTSAACSGSITVLAMASLQWRHNDHDGVSNTSLTVVYSTVYTDADQSKHQSSRHWPLCGEFTGTGEFLAQRASYAENVSIWWRHHVFTRPTLQLWAQIPQHWAIIHIHMTSFTAV